MTQTIDPEGAALKTSYRYDALGRQSQITEANGCIKQFVYDNQGRLIQTCVDPQGINSITQWTYDERGLVIRQTQINAKGLNKVVAYEWDALGRQQARIVDPDGLVLRTEYEYDADDNLIKQTDANGHSKRFVYDVTNRCRYEINAQGVVTEHFYSLQGDEYQTITYAKALPELSQYGELEVAQAIQNDPCDQYQFRWNNSMGQVLRFYDSLGYAKTYEYDKNGNMLHSCEYALPVSIEYLKKRDYRLPSPAESREQWRVYDGRNQLRFQWGDNKRITEYQYDKTGLLIKTTKYTLPVYISAAEIPTIESVSAVLQKNSADQTQHYAYDKAGHLILELSAQGIATSYEYDALGQITASTVYAQRVNLQDNEVLATASLKPSSQDRTRRFVYDTAGREVFRISAEGRVLERRYDALSQVIAECSYDLFLPASKMSLYDILEILKTQNRPGLLTRFDYDATGRLVQKSQAGQIQALYTYDKEGNVITQEDAQKALWTYTYDACNRLIETRSPLTSVQYGSQAQWRRVLTLYRYDSFGNKIATISDAEGLKQMVYNEYDVLNRCIKTRYPNAAINTAVNQASSQRQESILTLTEVYEYNAFDQCIASCNKAGFWTHQVYNLEGLLQYQINTQGGVTGYHYDDLGRLSDSTQYAIPINLGTLPDYSRQSVSDALHKDRKDRHEYYIYNKDNQLIESRKDTVRQYNPKTKEYVPGFAPTTQYTYNAFGEVVLIAVRIDDTDWANTYTYYDKDGLIKAQIDAQGYLTSYELNGLGEVSNMIEHALAALSWNETRYQQGPVSNNDRHVSYLYDAWGRLTHKILKQVRFERLKPNSTLYDTLTQDLTTSYSYDALGRLVKTTDAQGHQSYCYYDALGQITAKVGPLTSAGRAATTYAYDALGHLVETKRWAQGASLADETHFVLKGSSSADELTQQDYNAQGQLITERNGLHQELYYSYDAQGQVARRWRTLIQIDGSAVIQDERYIYDSEGHMLQQSLFKNNGGVKVEQSLYNRFGEVISQGLNGQFHSSMEYDSSGRLWRSTTQGVTQIFVYDLRDKVTQVVTSTNGFSAQYGELGVDLTDALYELKLSYDDDHWLYDLQRHTNEYDALGRLVRQNKQFTASAQESAQPTLKSAIQSQTLDRWGNILKHTDVQGHETHYEYNAFNEVIRQELPEVYVVDEHGVGRLLKPVTRYAYDELGQSLAMVDANGHRVSQVYDASGQIIAEFDGRSGVRLKYYNLLGQLTQLTNESGIATSYTYDAANRLIALQTGKVDRHYYYDAAGQLIHQKNGQELEGTFFYDSLGNQVLRYDSKGVTTQFVYDDAGHKTQEWDALGHYRGWTYNAQGQLVAHQDFAGHQYLYSYNRNGLLKEETSTTGKHLFYSYQGDGQLSQWLDEGQEETVQFTYDVKGQLLHKESSRGKDAKNGWIREIEDYQYDAQGRLTRLAKRNPKDIDNRVPDKDPSLWSVDYEYDSVGNIRHTRVTAHQNNTGSSWLTGEAYYLYDENNRMTLNKGLLVNGQIQATSTQGTQIRYDAVGQIQDALTYESGGWQNYHYQYNSEQQLELVRKNGVNLQSKTYDKGGRVVLEQHYDAQGRLAQKTILSYNKNGVLEAQKIEDALQKELSRTQYGYDAVGNLLDTETYVPYKSSMGGTRIKHHYTYALWDDYQQGVDEVVESDDSGRVSAGFTKRVYDKNGQLQEIIDGQSGQATHYTYSGLEGLKAKEDKEGVTRYFNLAGQTLGDLHQDIAGDSRLTIYGGFTPSGKFEKQGTPNPYGWQGPIKLKTLQEFKNNPPSPGLLPPQSQDIQPELPQDTPGSYTVQAGDTLEQIALTLYGDSSLWYLLADANGIRDRHAQAGQSDQLQISQRLSIPTAALGQHHTSATHNVRQNQSLQSGPTGLGLIAASPIPAPQKHNVFLAKIIVGVVAAVATIFTAGIMGALVGVASQGGLFATGLALLGGNAATLGATLAGAFSAGFVGNLVSQSVGKALELQDSISLKNAFLSGLTSAASAGLMNGLNQLPQHQQWMNTLESLPVTKAFNTASSLQLMEQNLAGQTLNLTLQKHQHLDWEQLALSGATAGIMGGEMGQSLRKSINTTLDKLDQHTGILSSEFKSLTQAGLNAILSHSPFKMTKVIINNFGETLLSSVINLEAERKGKLKLKEMEEDINGYCSIQQEENAFSLIPDDTYIRFYKEALAHQAFDTEFDTEKELGDYESLDYDFKSFACSSYENKNIEKICLENLEINKSPKWLKSLHATEGSLDLKEFLEDQSKINARKISPAAQGLALYDIDYSKLYAKKGFAYTESQIVSHSYYKKSPGSPITGDASEALQRKAIDTLISSSIEHGLSFRETAHVLAIARHESSFNPYAAAGTSSATGLGQFIDSTGKKYGINNLTRWDINKQADALVKHFIDNKALVIKNNLPERHIYQVHHDGHIGYKDGLILSNKFIMPKIGDMMYAIRNIFK